MTMSNIAEITRSPVAERMKLHRERKRMECAA
jgi:hypothetical protein